MLAIKLKRIGKKKQATFRIVVAEKRSKMAGRNCEDLGYFNPHNNLFNINKEKAAHWIKVGAQPTDSTYNLLVRAGVIKGAKRPVHQTAPEKPVESEQPLTEQVTEMSQPNTEQSSPIEQTDAKQTPVEENTSAEQIEETPATQ